jgi:hypothetical protein
VNVTIEEDTMSEYIIFTTEEPAIGKDFGTGNAVLYESYDFGLDGLYAAHVSTDGDPNKFDSPLIHEIQPNFDVELATAIDQTDEPVPEQYVTIGEVRDLHDCPVSHARGEGVHVVTMDSGVDKSHPVFSYATIDGHDVTGNGDPFTDEVGHGTAVMGQIQRLAPKVDHTMLRIFGDSGSTSLNNIMKAYEWLHKHADGIDIVNMSWGSPKSVSSINEIHNRLIDKGVRDVTAAGNSGSAGGSPSTAAKAFSVGATDGSGKLTDFSSYNPEKGNPDVCAVGQYCVLPRAAGTSMGTVIDHDYVAASGTSFSAPETAGMVAKYMSKRPKKSIEDVVTDFELASRDIPNTIHDGNGIVDYSAAIMNDPPIHEPENPTKPDGGDQEDNLSDQERKSVIMLIRQFIRRLLRALF